MTSAANTSAGPAKVYPDSDAPAGWVVEAPEWTAQPDGHTAPVLSSHGSAALAMRYAFERSGGARFFAF
jgi:hypothetical protein